MLKGLLFFLRFGWKSDKRYVLYKVFNQLLQATIPLVTIILPKYIIDELTAERRLARLAVYVAVLIGYTAFVAALSNLFSKKSFTLRVKLAADWGVFMHRKLAEADFENLESPDFMDLRKKAEKFLYGDWRGFSYVFDSALDTFGKFVTLLGIISIIATLHIGIVLLFIVLVLVSSYVESCAKKKSMKLSLEAVPVERRWNYFSELFETYQYGKEIRLNNIAGWLLQKEKDYAYTAVDFYRRMNRYHIWSGWVSAILSFIQQGAAYGYVIWSVLNGVLGIGDFFMYIGAITTFADAMRAVMNNFAEVKAYGIYYDAVIEYMNIPGTIQNMGTRTVLKKPHEIVLQNVSFRYKGQEQYALKNINLTIHPGEKISIVGENGAGKSTLIKLITRLYQPTEGAIYLDGINICDYTYDEYTKLFSAVFQDYALFTLPLAENVALREYDKTDEKSVNAILKQVGFAERLVTLSKGLRTHVHKLFEEDGFEPSGGEGQKIAIARALYKDADFVILDEPTAALDPKAEFEIYRQFDELVKGKTALYISHRLSSAKFCDRIIVMRQGEIVEDGTHNELIENAQGLYRELFQMQAQFYSREQ